MKLTFKVFISLAFLTSSCMGTKFSRVTDNYLDLLKGEETSFVIDSTYCLYMRQVLSVPNAEGLRVPESNPHRERGSVIEKQYLLISEKKGHAIVINNIPNKYVSFYNYPEDALKITDVGKEEVDIWFFNQFRFGILGNNNSIFFPGVVSGKPQIWQFKEADKNLNLISLAECDNDGSNVYLIDPAYAVPLLFYKIIDFQLVYKDNSDIKLTDKPEKLEPFKDSIYSLDENKIHLLNIKNKWYTYFRLKDYPDVKRNILFQHTRMYSAPFKGDLPCFNSLPLITQ
jgi:hypothetical protein